MSQWVNGEFQSCFLARLATTKSTLWFSACKSFHSSRKSTAIVFNHFWPDLASAHYADATQQFLKDKGIWYIPKYNNPPAVASLRPIEDFWAAVKKENYNSGWEAEDFAQLKQRILAKARQILPDVILNLLRTVPDQTQKCVEKGYLAVHKWALFKKSGL